jgi:hypothetical protein
VTSTPSQTAQEPRSARTRIKATLENRPICAGIAVRSWIPAAQKRAAQGRKAAPAGGPNGTKSGGSITPKSGGPIQTKSGGSNHSKSYRVTIQLPWGFVTNGPHFTEFAMIRFARRRVSEISTVLKPIVPGLLLNGTKKLTLTYVVEFSILWPIISPICHSTRPVNRTVSP